MLILQISKGEDAGKNFPITGDGEILIGRSRSAQLKLPDVEISGKHTLITVKGESITVTNLSKNGTLLDGIAIEGEQPLKIGQVLTLRKGIELTLADQNEDDLPTQFLNNETMSELGAPTLSTDVLDTAEDDKTEVMSDPLPLPPTSDAPSNTHSANTLPSTATPAPLPLPADAMATKPLPPDPDPQTPVDRVDTPVPSQGPSTPVPDPDPTAIPSDYTPAALMDDEDAFPRTSVSSGDQTQEQKTIVGTREEIDKLKRSEQSDNQRRIILMFAVILICGLVIVLARPKAPPPEPFLNWPDTMTFTSKESPWGAYTVSYASISSTRIAEGENGFSVYSHIGRDMDVPYNVHLEEFRDNTYATNTLEEIMSGWRSHVLQASTDWTFDAPWPKVYFMGAENGIPYRVLPYQKQDEVSMSGLIYFLRNGDRLTTVRIEIPAAEYHRGERQLYAGIWKVDADYVRSYWDFEHQDDSSAPGESLRRAQLMMKRNAPMTWGSIERYLMNDIYKLSLAADTAKLDVAREQLRELRRRKYQWFASHDIQARNARYYEEKERLASLKGMASVIFPHPHDRRYESVRRW